MGERTNKEYAVVLTVGEATDGDGHPVKVVGVAGTSEKAHEDAVEFLKETQGWRRMKGDQPSSARPTGRKRFAFAPTPKGCTWNFPSRPLHGSEGKLVN